MKKLLFFFLFLCTLDFFAQSSVRADLKKVNQAYRSADNLSMDISAIMYKDKNDQTGSLVGSGGMKKSGKKYYSKFGKDEMLINEKGVLIIDNQKKFMTYYEPENTAIKNTMELPDVDSILAQTDSIVYKGEDGDSKHYCFYDKDAAIKQTDIYVYKKNALLKRIIYYYKEGNEEESYDMYKVVIDYKNIKLDKPNDAVFSEKKYVLIEGGIIKPTPAYQTYKLKISENE
jgi:hypothetical protein